MPKQKKLRVGVIGLGMGRGHIQGYRSHPAAEVVAIADLDEKRLRDCAKEFAIPAAYQDAKAMLRREALDIVSVATPNKFHKAYTLAALRAGCHVLCEKPMAMNAAEARQMLAAAKAARRRLMINFSFRFSPQAWALKQEVDRGVLGHVYYARTVWLRRRGIPGFGGWFGQKALSGGGPLIDLGVHRLDLALWYMGYPKPVWALGGTYGFIGQARAKREGKAFDVEDMAAASVRFDNGAMLQIEASWAGNIRENDFMETRVLGTAGGLLQRNLNEGYDFDGEIYVERDGCQFDVKPHNPIPNVRGSMHHFVDAIVNKTPHTATGEEGLAVMKILDAIYASAKSKRPVAIK